MLPWEGAGGCVGLWAAAQRARRDGAADGRPGPTHPPPRAAAASATANGVSPAKNGHANGVVAANGVAGSGGEKMLLIHREPSHGNLLLRSPAAA